MLELCNILWVIPGIIFLHFYDRHVIPVNPKKDGWPYVFFLVFIAFLSWMPAWKLVEIYTATT